MLLDWIYANYRNYQQKITLARSELVSHYHWNLQYHVALHIELISNLHLLYQIILLLYCKLFVLKIVS